jgi:predicted GNAT family N-acyltransferase
MPFPLTIAEAPYGSSLYSEMLALREKILRAPLGLALTDADKRGDADQIHLAAKIGERLVGCAILVPADAGTMKLRQMAVEDGFQGQKIGQKILAYAETLARTKAYQRIQLHARETAVGFYERSGYHTVSGPFLEVTIPHREMEKSLSL